MADAAVSAPAPVSSNLPSTIDEAAHGGSEDQPSATALATQETGISAPSSATPNKVIKKVVRKKRRPARAQVDPSTIDSSELPPQTGTIFNIWYNKWSGGDREDKYLSKNPAKGRCSIARDAGYTRADRVVGSFFCRSFARGLCPKGQECENLHRLPTIHDHFNPNVDCFGRDKLSDYRDDMGGVGSFMRQNRTLYVGRIHVSDDIEEIVARHFAEWGEVERIRVLNSRGVGFVTYCNEANSQFAKEAMSHQALDHGEILNVRWATVDPNPLAAAREARNVEEQAAEAVRRALPDEFVREIEGRDPDAAKRKRIEGSFGLQGYQAPDEVWYSRALPASSSSETGPSASVTEAEAVSLENTAPVKIGKGAEEEEEPIGGILSTSTLAALKSRRPVFGVPPPSTTAGAGGLGAGGGIGSLLAYGSDDEED